MNFPSVDQAIQAAKTHLRNHGEIIKSPRWQGIDVDFDFFEVLNYSFTCNIPHTVVEARELIRPNLPWADDHFLERVGRNPLNPGNEYKNWPFYRHAKDDKIREGGQFTHTYMERFWPKRAGSGRGDRMEPHMGIRYPYGDLDDVIDLLVREPYTRQAFFPIWFPEDTGVVHRGRVPCTLGYHFLMRNSKLHMIYHIRSCDYLRHFRDDVYMACRLLLWMLDECLDRDRAWRLVKPGTLTMHIGSFHVFDGEQVLLNEGSKW